MADNTVNLTLKLKAEGLETAQKGTKQIRDNLEGAQAAAQGIGTSGSASSRRVASSAAARPTGAAGVSAGIESGDIEMYNRARGAAGAAGGTARDFADQARGLGGLVRLYATFAANIFAVTAAFSALSKAMDTTNMVSGLDQLGAATGRNLGSLSKQLALASDGAVSLREAMEATAKASSAGLSSKQILELGDGAKKAAQALGLNMTDALSRLSRGISKIEPELLDELGIYVKIDDATQNYARTVGKAANSLTEFERRQAFAVAALDQLKQKFGDIQIDVNPYTKLSASLQNLLQTGLELVNKVLGPLVKVLSESPVALAVILGVIAKTLINQAIPYFGQFRKSIEDQAIAANKAVEIAEKNRSAYKAYKEELIGTAVAQAELTDRLKATEAVSALSKSTKTGTRKIAREEIVSAVKAEGDVVDVNLLRQATSEIDKQIKALERSKAVKAETIQKNKEEIQDLQKAKLAIEDKIKSAKAYKDVIDGTVSSEKKIGMFDTSKVAKDVRDLESARKSVKSIEVLKDVGNFYDAYGFKASFGELKNQLIANRKELGLFGTAMTGVKGVGLLLSSGLGQLFSAFQGFALAAGLATSVFETLDTIFSKNAKQAEETAKAFELVGSNTDNLSKTIDTINKKDILGQLSSTSLEARGNAVSQLADSVGDLYDKINKQKEAASWWDNFKDFLSKFAGADLNTKAIKDIAKTVDEIIKAAPEARKGKISQEFADILKIDPKDQQSIEAALLKTPSAFSELAPKLIAKAKDFGNQLKELGNTAKDLDSRFEQAGKTLDNFLISALPTDAITKLGVELQELGYALTQAIKDPTLEMSQMIEIGSKLSKLKLFDPETAMGLKTASKDLANYQATMKSYDLALESVNKNLTIQKTLTQKVAVIQNPNFTPETAPVTVSPSSIVPRRGGREEVATVEAQKQYLELLKRGLEEGGREQRQLLETSVKRLQNLGKEFVDSTINQLFAKARLTIASAFAQRGGETVAGIKERADIEKRQIDLQIQQLNSQLRLIENNIDLQAKMDDSSFAMNKLTLAIERSNILTDMTIKSEQDRKAKLDSNTEALGKLEKAREQSAGRPESLRQQSAQAVRGQIAGLQAQKEAITRRAEVELLAREAEIARDINTTNQKSTETAKQAFDSRIRMLPYLNAELLNTKQEFEYNELINKQEQERSQINLKIAEQNKTLATARDPKTIEAAKEKLAEFESFRARLLKRQEEDQAQFYQKNADGIAENTNKERTYRLDLAKFLQDQQNKRLDFINQEKLANEDLYSSKLETAKKYGLITEQQYVLEKSRLALEKEREQYSRSIQGLETSRTQELAPLQQQQAAFLQTQGVQKPSELTDPAAIQFYSDLQAKIDSLNSTYAVQKSAIDAANTSKLYSLQLTQQEQLAAAKLSDTFGKLAEVLGVLGDTGKRFGEALLGLATAQSNYEQQSLVLSKDTSDRKAELAKTESIIISNIRKSDYDSEEDREAAIREVKEKNVKAGLKIDEDAAKKGTKLEVDRNIAIINSGKKMFKEKTAAYKIMDAMEKGMHVYKMIMLGKEMATEAIATVQSIARTISEMASVGVLAVLTQGKGDPYTAFARMAAMAAAVSALISSVGGGSGPKVQAGTTAKDRQEVQGTGMEWRDGQKVETGRGVFGDPEAKSDSISKSLERIRQTNVEGITYASKTVKLLESIDRSIGGAAKSLYGVVGLRTGTGFGTREGTSSSGIQGLFGSKRTTEIIDAGIKFAGTFLDVMMGKAGSIMQYERTRTTKTSSGFLGIGGGTSTWETELQKDLGQVDKTAAQEVSKIFTNAGDLMIELGSKLGKTQQEVLTSLAGVDLTGRFASLRGLKGEELQKELNSVISSILDDAAGVAFKSLQKFRKFGEGMAETVMRVLDTNQKINDSFVSMGAKTLDTLVKETFGTQQIKETVVKSVSLPMDAIGTAIGLGLREILGVVKTSMFGVSQVVTEEVVRPISEAELKQKALEISEGLAELAGGLDKFLEKQKFFVDNFLTEAERLDPIRRALTDQLNQLGLGFVDTREEFKQVVLALSNDVTSAGGRELYNALLDLAPAFNQVYKEAEKTKEALTELELRNKLLDQELTILGLLGRDQEALALKRQRELDELRKYPGIQGDLLAANQEYIYALEDEKAAKDKLIKQRDKEKQALDSTIKSLTGAIDTLKKYRSSLLTGGLTTLAPQQQYQQNKTAFEELAVKLRTGTTEERVAAASELQSLGDKFLESSRTMFASSSAYATDFNSVLSILDESAALLSTQKTDAEKSLDELMKSTAFLDNIETNTKTTSDLLAEYITAQDLSKQQDAQRQDLRQQWEQSLLESITTMPEVTLDVQPIVSELVQVKNALIAQAEAQAAQNTAAVAVSHADLQSILTELEQLRKAQQDMADSAQREVFAPVWEDTGA